MRAESDGFVAPPHRRGALQTECPFVVSPVLWLRELIAVRRNGHDFALMRMGQLLHGNGHRLTAADFV
ncbi:hypothetical protein BDZ89DRAFT_1075356 [Hymenopellis radicata]|nr:hypothetical protein BDZ89DRAFT_1075356 [Hymenopellis radicata]